MPRPAVFLDRDGTLIKERDYLSDPDGVELEDGAATALLDMQARGLALVLVTNQSGVGRGLFGPEALASVHRRLAELLAREGVVLDGWYVCPHRPEDACGCRKPRPGLVAQAVRDLGVNPSTSFVVGDKMSDVLLAGAIGATGILVATGHGAGAAAEAKQAGFLVCANLAEAGTEIARRRLLSLHD
jgi:histidinol-phosphate phosphatase family protein